MKLEELGIKGGEFVAITEELLVYGPISPKVNEGRKDGPTRRGVIFPLLTV